MKWTVIGYWGGYPGVKEASSGYLLEHDGFRLLVDCGSGVLAQLQAFVGVGDIDAVILSHYHHDHIADVGPLQFARLVESMTHGQLPELPIYGHTLDSDGFYRLDHKGYTKGQAYDPEQPLQIGPFSISFMKTKHPVPCFAMRLEAGSHSVVYTADSSYLPGFIDFAKDADLLVCECNFYAGQDAAKAGHMNSHDAATIAREAGVGQLLLTHLPHFGKHEDLVKQAGEVFDRKVDLARIGWQWSAE
ncbi:MAG TPA: MBL fold metallo-hydrolase [Bacillales bacterium]